MSVHLLVPLIVAAIMAAVIGIASGFEYLQAKLSILVSAGMVLILALILVVKEIRFKAQAAKPGANLKRTEARVDVSLESGASAGQYLSEVAWMAGFLLTIYLVGFVVAIPVITFAYMKTHGSKWLASILTGVLMATFCYAIFTWFLGVELYGGEIFIRLGLL